MIERWMTSLLVISALSLSGCGEQSAGSSAEPAQTDPIEAESPPAEVPEPSAEQVPVAEDFADEAQAQITEDNYRAELEQIEADLGAE